MNLPRSSLLDRLEAFLPKIEEANQTTHKLAQEGTLEVLDSNLEVAGSEQQREESAERTDEEQGEDDIEEQEQRGGGVETGTVPPRTVQLDFALGDFDHTPIAKMEQEKEAAGQAQGAQADIAGESEGDAGENGVAGIVRLAPGKNEVDATAPRKKTSKPLIEEL